MQPVYYVLQATPVQRGGSTKAVWVVTATLLLSVATVAQTRLDLSNQGRNPDFSLMPVTKPLTIGATLPPACQLGQLFFNTSAAAGANIFGCVSPNNWTGIGGSALRPASATTLGGVLIPSNSGLTVQSDGTLTINFGITVGTAAAGNDPRIVNALQPVSLIPASNVTGLAPSATVDTTNAANIRSGTLSATLFPATITSHTSGNAATATSLAAAPSQCPQDAFATGVAASGSANCAQPAFSNLFGSLATTQMPALNGDVTSPAGTTTTTVMGINGAAVPTSATVVGTNANGQLIDQTGTIAPSVSSSTRGGILNNNGSASGWSYPSLDCSQFPGLDMSLKIQNCLVALNSLNSQGGVADARSFQRTQTWSVNPFAAASLPRSGTLLMPCVDISVHMPVLMPSFWRLKSDCYRGFAGQSGTNLIASAGNFHAWANPDAGTITTATANGTSGVTVTGSGTSFSSNMVGCDMVAGNGITTGAVSLAGVITSVSSATSLKIAYNVGTNGFSGQSYPYAVYCPVIVMGAGTPTAGSSAYMFGIQIDGINADCNNIAGCVGISNWFAEEMSEVRNFSIHGSTNIGLDRETVYSQNSGPYTGGTITMGAAAGALAYVSRTNGGSVRGAENMTVSGTAGTPITLAFDIETPGEQIRNIHFEQAATGVRIGGTGGNPVTCPVACPTGHLNAHGVVLEGIQAGGSAGGTNVVAIGSGQDNITLQNVMNSQGTAWTNTLLDESNGNCAVTGLYLGLYSLDNSGKIKYSTAAAGCLGRALYVVNGWCSGSALGSSATYAFAPFNTTSASTCNAGVTGFKSPSEGMASNLYVISGAAGTSAGGEVITLNVNGTDTALRCTYAPSATSCSDTTHAVTLHAGDVYYLKISTVASETIANVRASFQVQ